MLQDIHQLAAVSVQVVYSWNLELFNASSYTESNDTEPSYRLENQNNELTASEHGPQATHVLLANHYLF